MILNKLDKAGLIHPPNWLITNCHYLTRMGSYAYGVSNDCSDEDVYGFCIPPKENVFPHLAGVIPGFGRQIQKFEQWQEHHIKDISATHIKKILCPMCGVELSPFKDFEKSCEKGNIKTDIRGDYVCYECWKGFWLRDVAKDFGKEYDFSVYSIVKYFQLCMDNNPNMIDSLFTDTTSVLHSTAIGELVRENRRLFLHKGAWHKFKGYAYAQLHKIEIKEHEGKRAELVKKFGYDTKYAYHLVRLLLEVEQIMIEHDLDLRKNAEILKSIRRGEWKLEYLRSWFEEKQKVLEKVYAESDLRYNPDEPAIKDLLLRCLEHHYGSLDKCVSIQNSEAKAIAEIKEVLRKYNQ